jgi:uracil-DNA glycosylase
VSDTIGDLARATRALLAYQGDLGLRGLDVALTTAAAPVAATTRAPAAAALVASGDEARAEAMRLVAAIDGGPTSQATKGGRKPHPSVVALAPELRAIRDELGDCKRCKLHSTRTNLVFGVGHPKARLMFIGEAPGRDEDLLGEPFVGAAGQLLDKMIKAMGLSRAEVYIANILKSRPPGNRDPEPDEVAACEPFLNRQIAVIGPEVIVALGRISAQTLLRDDTPVSRLRGTWREYRGIPLMPTFHPAYLLRNPAEKKPVWDDLREVMKKLGLQQEPAKA